MDTHEAAAEAPRRRRSGRRSRADEATLSPKVRAGSALIGALVLGATLLAVVAVAPSPVEAIGRLPKCRLADIMTVPRDYGSWSTTLVDWLLRVEKNYVPPDLVPVTDAGIAGGGLIRNVTIKDLGAMARAAARNGTPIGVWSPYRSYQEQVQIFTGYSNQFGFEDAITYSHRPGHSEHQLGLAIDFMSAGGGNPLIGDWVTTPAGAWMAENAWKFGWVMSYPIENPGGPLWSDKICFTYEPWHYRYLGRRVAKLVHDSGLTIREYLWTHYTMVDPKTGEPLPTATPPPSPSPTPTPTPTASPTAEVSAIPEATAAPAHPGASAQPGRWLGVDQPVVVVGLVLVVLASFALVTWRRILAR